MAMTQAKGAGRQDGATSVIETGGATARGHTAKGYRNSNADDMHSSTLAAAWQLLLVCSVVATTVRPWSMPLTAWAFQVVPTSIDKAATACMPTEDVRKVLSC